MKRKDTLLICMFFFYCSITVGQNNDSLFTRLQANINNGVTFYNVDGIEITSQAFNSEFSEKEIVKQFKRYTIKESDLKTRDDSLPFKNFSTSKSKEIAEGVTETTSYYFVENKDKSWSGITFVNVNKRDITFEKEFVNLIYNHSIPKEVFEPLQMDSINFAGRKIALGASCKWMGINNLQCPYYGQMNWSVHRDSTDAENSLNYQFILNKKQKGIKIISETEVEIIFEGNNTKAKKVVYDFKGIKSLLVGMSGGKSLTVYYVATRVRNNFVSCVLSHWNNDSINKSGLPALLEQVMKLK